MGKQDIEAMTKEAEERGISGDPIGCEEAKKTAEDYKKQLEEINNWYRTYYPAEALCEKCGLRYLVGNEEDGAKTRRESDVWEKVHFASKVHKSWDKIREKYEELKANDKKERENEQSRPSLRSRERSRSRDRNRERYGDRGRDSGRGREGDRDWDRGRARERPRNDSRARGRGMR